MGIIKIKGKVVSGVKKGAYYVSLDVYRKFFKKLLGKEPFPGTLNIELNDGVEVTSFLKERYNPPDKKYSPIFYALGKMCNKTVVIIRPKMSVHRKNVIEVVADERLREKFNLKDGDSVEIEINV